MNNTILLIPEKTDIEFEQIVAAWTHRGGQVKRLGKYWIKDEELTRSKIAIYGNQAFAFVLAQIYGVALLSPDDTLIATLDHQWTQRQITLSTVGQISATAFPVFIKPVVPKIFLAGIFTTLEDFRQATAGLPEDEAVMMAAVVEPITAEARGFVLNEQLIDLALYEGGADLTAGALFLTAFVREYGHQLPAAVIVDIACNPQTGWFVLEFNACWGAGLNNCRAEKVMDCIISATIHPALPADLPARESS
ncbi:ATP-grasp domain-containing protein [Chitinophaga sp. HK235]|uniref:ATP-grasp domain-containing protein n=1 Tax=Chitinophaga sp. HK235 TaxID=2952571 RepID=UPI001BA91827|nr:ATP-grasp domain-containing protein [Chitinophaga sp. HK235]